MDRSYLARLKPERLPSPCFVVDEHLLEKNLAILDRVQRETGARVLLALKCFAMFSVFPLLNRVLKGTCASGPYEARLGSEEFGGEVHVASPAYSDSDMDELLTLADHIVFNSFGQFERFYPKVRQSGRNIAVGLRINPRHSEVKTPIYDPCAPGSRLGISREHFEGKSLDGVTGLHFHTLCELDSDSLERTLEAVERQFGEVLHGMEWLNMGGGHHITREGYDIERLCRLIERTRKKYDLQVYLEPGEAVALNAGILVSTVLDVTPLETPVAILDTSAACHMPDVLEMPYRPEVIGAAMPGVKRYTYALGGKSCLAGDVVGEYSFDHPLKPGDMVAFCDMAIYSMVKTNTFNGVPLPAIARYRPETDALHVVRRFDYLDFKSRLS